MFPLPWRALRPWLCLAGIVSCRGDSTGPSAGVLWVDVRVLDAADHPLPISVVDLEVWRHDAGLELLGRHLTDSKGHARWQDTLAPDGGRVDSVTVGAIAGRCDPDPPIRSEVVRAATDSLTATLRLPRLDASAVQAGTEYCGPGFGLFGGTVPSGFWVSFVVDSITDSLRGRWQIAYNESRRTEFGAFSGRMSPGEVRLQLRPGDQFAVCEPSYELVLTLTPAGTIRSGRVLAAGGCVVYDTPFEVSAHDDPYFP